MKDYLKTLDLGLEIRTYPINDQKPIDFHKDGAFLLEVQETYAYIGIDPILDFQTVGNQTKVYVKDQVFFSEEDPFHLLRIIQQAFDGVPLVGFMAYEAACLFEKLPQPIGEPSFADLHFMIHSRSYVFNYSTNTILERIIPNSFFVSKFRCNVTSVQKEVSDKQYCKSVKRAQEYIEKGDAFQIVLSRSFLGSNPMTPKEVYCELCEKGRMPFMYLYEGDEYSVVGASPERLVKLEDGIVETMPIAGSSIGNELVNNPKEVAEHMMLVDLGRNDVGRVAKSGTVTVPELMSCKHYPHISHLVSVVQGELKEGLDGWDVLRAVFPAGTLTGAPKIRAMEIIHELEGSRRGLYGGAVILMEGLHKLDAIIAIRMAVFQSGNFQVRAGAGIVYDSIPEREADETRHKAKFLLNILRD